MRSTAPLLAATAALAVTLFVARPAQADASAWMFAGAGATSWKNGADSQIDPALAFDIGVGTTPDAAYIVGGLFRVAPILGHGADLALQARVATHDFQAGDFGLALDAGGYWRTWGADSTGFAGGLVLGAPLGLQLSVQTMVGTNDAFSIGAVAGIDFLRLTVFRRTMLDWWTNPLPAQRTARSGLGSSF